MQDTGARYSLTASDIRRNSPYILTARFPKATASAVFFAVAARIDQLPATVMGQRDGFKHQPFDRVLRIAGSFEQVADVLLADAGVSPLKNLIQSEGEIARGGKILDALGSSSDDGLLAEDRSLLRSRQSFVGFWCSIARGVVWGRGEARGGAAVTRLPRRSPRSSTQSSSCLRVEAFIGILSVGGGDVRVTSRCIHFITQGGGRASFYARPI